MDTDQYYKQDRKLSEKDVEDLLESSMVLREHIDGVLMKLRQVDNDAPYDCEDCRMDIDQSGIDFTWEEDTGCCGYSDMEYHSYFLPARYLWEDLSEMLADAKERIRKDKEEEKRKKAEQKVQRAADKERKEYEKFVELQKKFGGES